MGRTGEWSAAAPIALGLGTIVVLLGSLGAWSMGTRIAGAVVAPGIVEAERARQPVQHPEGGVVGEILARDGDAVAAGDVLLRLDGTFLRSELAIVEAQMLEIHARAARLEAEARDADHLLPGPVSDFVTLAPEAVAAQLDAQDALFEARRASLAQKLRQIAEQRVQIERQIEGIAAQAAAIDRQLALLGRELGDIRALFDKGLVPASRLLDLEREEARLQGEAGTLAAAEAEARARIAGLALDRLALYDQRREEAITRLRDLGVTAAELAERRLSLVERLDRLDIRAPVAGTVFGSRVGSARAVVQPGAPMMYLVPGGQALQVSARIDPIHIDQVHAGQEVALMFTAFNRRTTPEVPGAVLRVSPDAARDEATGEAFYEAVILPDAAALAALDHVRLIPGMPVEAFLRTEARSPLSYLVQPLTVYFQRAFREE